MGNAVTRMISNKHDVACLRESCLQHGCLLAKVELTCRQGSSQHLYRYSVRQCAPVCACVRLRAPVCCAPQTTAATTLPRWAYAVKQLMSCTEREKLQPEV